MLKKSLFAVVSMVAGITSSYAQCVAPKMPKIENASHALLAASNMLENLEGVIQNKPTCAATYRKALAGFTPELTKLESTDLEPAVKTKTAPLSATYTAALQDGIELAELDKRIDAFYQAAADYRNVAFKNAWEYSSQKDEMRGHTTYYWVNESTDSAPLDFPYKAAKARFVVVQREENGVIAAPRVMIQVTDGQLNYNHSNAAITAKFDNQSLTSFNGEICNDKNQIFCPDMLEQSLLLGMLRSSNTAIVELQFFQNGSYQYHFNIAGLSTLRPTSDIKKTTGKK